MKTQINVSIDIDLAVKGRDRNAPFSRILTEALEKWLVENESIEDRANFLEKSKQDALDAGVVLEAEALVNAPGDMFTPYLMKMVKADFKRKGYSEEQINKIYEKAHKMKNPISSE